MEKKDRFKKIALTGGAGSGKSLVLKRLNALGVITVDSDSLAREAVLPGKKAYKEILRRFGESVLLPEGGLNRSRLREIIVNDPQARKDLESMVHPEIFRLMEKRIQEAKESGKSSIVIEIPLIFELGLENKFDLIVTVSLERGVQMERLIKRDSVSRNGAEALLGAQLSDEEKVSRSDYVIDNNGSVEDLIKKTDIFHGKYLKS